MSRLIPIDRIDPHPDADLFPHDAEHVKRLAEDIRERGIATPVHLYPNGDRFTLLAGHDRVMAATLAGLKEVPADMRSMLSTEAARFEYFIKDNTLRKHLNQEQTRSLIAALLKRYADQSDREIARMVGCHHTTVSTVRGELESIGEISQCDRQTSDGRTYPAERKPRTPKLPSKTDQLRQTREAQVEEHEKTNGANAPAEDHKEDKAMPATDTMEERVREAMALEASGERPEEVAEAVGLTMEAYRLSRFVVLLADDADLPAPARERAAAALCSLNSYRSPSTAYKEVADLVERKYGTAEQRRGGSPERAAERRVNDFMRAYGVLIQACTTAPTIDIPMLPQERAAELCRELDRAARCVHDLKHKIEEASK